MAGTPGLAKTDTFMLGTATVMIGPAADLLVLNPTDHSIGLVKNFQITSEPEYTELFQGVQGTRVASVMTANPVRASMEVYEYTAANLAYGLGLDGSTFSPITTAIGNVEGAITGNSTPVTTMDLETGDGANFPSSFPFYIMISRDAGDDVLIQKVTGKSTDQLTVSPGFGSGVNVADAAPVTQVNVVGIGSKTSQPYLAAKVVGVLNNGDQVVLLLPKLRITRGFSMAFSSDDWGNMPVEFQLYDLVSTDTHYSDFGGDQARILRT